MAMLVIGDVYTGLDRARAMSKISISFAFGSVFARVIGGGLAMLGWNYAFLFYTLSLPFAIVIITLLPDTKVQMETGDPWGDGGVSECSGGGDGGGGKTGAGGGQYPNENGCTDAGIYYGGPVFGSAEL